MRLIDENVTLQRFIQEIEDSGKPVIHINTIKRLLQDIDTAYDVDKVVDQLKCESCDECPLLDNCAANFGDDFMEKIREIVKAGGID